MGHNLTYDPATRRISFTLGADAVVGFEAVRLAADLDSIPEAILYFLDMPPLQALSAAGLLASPMMPTEAFEAAGILLGRISETLYPDEESHREATERAERAFDAALANLSMWEAE